MSFNLSSGMIESIEKFCTDWFSDNAYQSLDPLAQGILLVDIYHAIMISDNSLMDFGRNVGRENLVIYVRSLVAGLARNGVTISEQVRNLMSNKDGK